MAATLKLLRQIEYRTPSIDPYLLEELSPDLISDRRD